MYRLLFQEIADTALVLRVEQSAIAELTAAVSHATGWTPSALLGKPVRELLLIDVDEEQAGASTTPVEKEKRLGWLLAADGRRARVSIRRVAAGARGELFLLAFETVAWQSSSVEPGAGRVGLSPQVLERVLSFLPVGNYVTDSDFRITYWSPVCARIFGYQSHEVVGRRASELLTRRRIGQNLEVEQFAASLHARLRNGESLSGCNEGLCKDGRIIELEWQYAPIIDDIGQPLGYLVTLQDVTERERALRVLRESEARFRNVADNAPVMIWTTDATGACTYINQYWRDFTGSRLEDNLGTGWLSFLHVEDRERAAREFQKAIHGRRPLFLEYRLLRADGEYGYCLDTAVPRFGEGGEFLGFVGSAIDLTDRHAVEESLRSSEAFLSAILNTVADAIITTDEQGIIKALNPAALRMFGYSADELIGSNVSKLMAEPSSSPERGYIDRHMRRRARRTVSSEIEVQARRKDGHVFPARFAVDETWVGPRRLFISILHDLTEWYRLTERLQQAQKMDAVGRLAGGIAHDFNNLLTIINGYGELAIKRLPETGRVRDMVQAMCDAGQRAAGLTQQLLSFSRKQVISPTGMPVLKSSSTSLFPPGCGTSAESRTQARGRSRSARTSSHCNGPNAWARQRRTATVDSLAREILGPVVLVRARLVPASASGSRRAGTIF